MNSFIYTGINSFKVEAHVDSKIVGSFEDRFSKGAPSYEKLPSSAPLDLSGKIVSQTYCQGLQTSDAVEGSPAKEQASPTGNGDRTAK